MAKGDVAGERAEQGDACADQYGHARDCHPVDATGGEEALNRDAAVYVGVFEAAGFELLYDFRRFPRQLLDYAAFDGRKVERTATEYDDGLLSVRAVAECEHDFEGLAADHYDVDARVEFVKAVRLMPARVQEIESVIRAGEKAIDADSTKD
ncbi:MAG TPA: hypothetical protein VJN21_06480 [Candidatus Acidoferrales bacterium]|nr:hypothetical protein [Candidatus Acidoferrales bacterium]